MRVRVLGGKTFCTRMGRMVVGEMKDQFLLVDLDTVIHGSYRWAVRSTLSLYMDPHIWEWCNDLSLSSAASHGRTPTCTGSSSPFWLALLLNHLTQSSGSYTLFRSPSLTHVLFPLLLRLWPISRKSDQLSGFKIRNSLCSLRLTALHPHLSIWSWTGRPWGFSVTSAPLTVLKTNRRPLWPRQFR